MSVNKVILIGNVGQDPEIKNLEGNVKIGNLSLATTEKGYTTKGGKEIPERTDWHRLVFWGGTATVVEKYVKKGSQIYIEGKIRNRSYDDKDGIKRYVTEIYVEQLQLLGQKPSTGQTQAQAEIISATNLPDGDPDDLPF